MKELEHLFEEARAKGLWFYNPYYSLWFSPDELEAEQRSGKFRWGPVNWQLRDPSEYLNEAKRECEKAARHYDYVLSRVTGQGGGR